MYMSLEFKAIIEHNLFSFSEFSNSLHIQILLYKFPDIIKGQ